MSHLVEGGGGEDANGPHVEFLLLFGDDSPIFESKYRIFGKQTGASRTDREDPLSTVLKLVW